MCVSYSNTADPYIEITSSFNCKAVDTSTKLL
eukprot:SAG31_NODE_44455_length_262_cov_1.846626_1_plen_31_part_01